ncbi:metallophosphoesterase [Candidatus Woesearchaeota archaeon]|nr:metallophosphoesterase [Candidatus Woesearchaeota archaeon]
MKFGLFTDNHSSKVEIEELLINSFRDVDVIVSIGDNVEHSTKENLWQVLRSFCEIGKPFYAIPGNYETKDIWDGVCEQLSKRYSNFVNAAEKQVYQLNDLNLIFIPGTEDARRGFTVNKKDLEKVLKQVKPLTNKLLFTHEPPKQDYSTGTDFSVQAISIIDGSVVYGRHTKEAIDSGYYRLGATNQGSELIRSFVELAGINFVFSGHIHEGIGAVDNLGRKIEENTFTEVLYLNPGPAKNGLNAIMETKNVDGKLQAKYSRNLLLGRTFYEGLK